jgi:uncharacterized protein (DUF608 family)
MLKAVPPVHAQSQEDSSVPVSVWTSTLKRTIETAFYLPFPKLRWKVMRCRCQKLEAALPVVQFTSAGRHDHSDN